MRGIGRTRSVAVAKVPTVATDVSTAEIAEVHSQGRFTIVRSQGEIGHRSRGRRWWRICDGDAVAADRGIGSTGTRGSQGHGVVAGNGIGMRRVGCSRTIPVTEVPGVSADIPTAEVAEVNCQWCFT